MQSILLSESALIVVTLRRQALETLDGQIGAARQDLQALSRTDEQELRESRLIILQARTPAVVTAHAGSHCSALHLLLTLKHTGR